MPPRATEWRDAHAALQRASELVPRGAPAVVDAAAVPLLVDALCALSDALARLRVRCECEHRSDDGVDDACVCLQERRQWVREWSAWVCAAYLTVAERVCGCEATRAPTDADDARSDDDADDDDADDDDDEDEDDDNGRFLDCDAS